MHNVLVLHLAGDDFFCVKDYDLIAEIVFLNLYLLTQAY